MGAMVPPSRKSCYNFRVVSIDRVVDGGTKQKNFEELREIRRSFGTLDQG